MILRKRPTERTNQFIKDSSTLINKKLFTPNQQLFKINEEKPPFIHYIDFETKKIKFIRELSFSKLSPIDAFNDLLHRKNLFKRTILKYSNGKTKKTDQYKLTLNWPHRDGVRNITFALSYSDANTNGVIECYDEEKFLTLTLTPKNEINVERSKSHEMLWNESDIQSIIDTFKEILSVKKINYHYKKTISEQKEIVKNETQKLKPEQVKHYFSDQYTYSQITYRLQQSFLINAQDNSNQFSFKMDWQDDKNQHYPLNVILSKANKFQSWVFTETAFLNYFYPKYNFQQQFYYNLSIKELNNNEILNLKFTTDCQFGELYKVHKGTFDYKHGGSLSGNEVLKIYHFFDEIIPLKQTVLCDASKLPTSEHSTKLYLRLFLPIIYGKTWYENKIPGLRLLEGKNLKDTDNEDITQNSAERTKALKELQTLTLKKWYSILPAEKQRILLKLFAKYLCEDRVSTRKLSTAKEKLLDCSYSLKDLLTKIYDKSKTGESPSEDLINFNSLLNSRKLDPQSTELLDNGFYWIKKREDEANEIKSEKQLRI